MHPVFVSVCSLFTTHLTICDMLLLIEPSHVKKVMVEYTLYANSTDQSVKLNILIRTFSVRIFHRF